MLTTYSSFFLRPLEARRSRRHLAVAKTLAEEFVCYVCVRTGRTGLGKAAEHGWRPLVLHASIASIACIPTATTTYSARNLVLLLECQQTLQIPYEQDTCGAENPLCYNGFSRVLPSIIIEGGEEIASSAHKQSTQNGGAA
jgi:hypothetical protein